MKKIISIIVILLLICIGGGYYYYYNHLETITEVYLYKYTPPTEQTSTYGNTSYSTPKVEIIKTDYETEGKAIDKELILYDEYLSDARKQFEAEDFDKMETIEAVTKSNAYRVILAEQRYIITFTHNRDYDIQEIMNFIKRDGLESKALKIYLEDNKLSLKVQKL